jgi:hypothetical protein
MPIEIKHKAVAPLSEGAKISSPEWNDTHDLRLVSGRLVGRTANGTGPAEEISVGAGLSLSGTQLVNTSPDQTVVLGSGSGISITGTYPNFLITNVSPDQPVSLTSGSGISITGTYPNFLITSTVPSGVTSVSTGAGLTGGTITATGTISADIATTANLRAGTVNKIVDASGIYAANAPVTSSGSGSFALDFNTGRVFQRTLTGASTMANPTNQVAGQGGIIYILQDSSGGRNITYGANWKFIGGSSAINTTANSVNVFSYYVRSVGNISLSYLGSE